MLAITERKNEANKLNATPPSCCQYRVRQHIHDTTFIGIMVDSLEVIIKKMFMSEAFH